MTQKGDKEKKSPRTGRNNAKILGTQGHLQKYDSKRGKKEKKQPNFQILLLLLFFYKQTFFMYFLC